MNTEIVVCVPEELVEAAKQAVASGQAESVSAYVAAALDYYSRRPTLADFLAEMDAEFGPVPPEIQQEVNEEIERIAGPAPEQRAP